MALSTNNLSFSWSSPAEPTRRAQLLFFRRTEHIDAFQAVAHVHPFWQVELITKQRVECRLGETVHVLRAGEAVLLPPNTRHAFSYPDPEAGWVSFYFLREGERSAMRLDEETEAVPILRALLTMAAQPEPEQYRGAFEGLLDSLMFTVSSAPPRADDLVSLVESILRQQQGRYLSVAELAERCGYSTNHFSQRFRARAGMGIKKHMDFQRAEYAKQMLTYTGLANKVISRQMGFDSIFAFSRFFRRVAGFSPRAYRNCNRP